MAETVWVLNRNPLADTPGLVALNVSLFTSGFATVVHSLTVSRIRNLKGGGLNVGTKEGEKRRKGTPQLKGPLCRVWAALPAPARTGVGAARVRTRL